MIKGRIWRNLCIIYDGSLRKFTRVNKKQLDSAPSWTSQSIAHNRVDSSVINFVYTPLSFFCDSEFWLFRTQFFVLGKFDRGVVKLYSSGKLAASNDIKYNFVSIICRDIRGVELKHKAKIPTRVFSRSSVVPPPGTRPSQNTTMGNSVSASPVAALPAGTTTSSSPTSEAKPEKPKCKACCACPETKRVRDAWWVAVRWESSASVI